MTMNALIFIGLAASASALTLDLSKEAVEKSNEGYMLVLQNGMSTESSAAKSALMAELDKYTTEEGQTKTFQKVIDTDAQNIKDAEMEMEWFSDVAKDGVVDMDGTKFPILGDTTMGRLPKGLPEFPTDPEERAKFIYSLPVDSGMYATMLAIKKDPTKLMDVKNGDFKKHVASLLEQKLDGIPGELPAASLLETMEEVKTEKHQTTVEIIKASPKEFKIALKHWEKVVPNVATMLLQTSSDETEEQAMVLAKHTQDVHKRLYQSVEKVTDKETLMTVAQNRITALLVRQATDFDALEGCAGDASKDLAGAQTWCLCVADNLCHHTQKSTSGNMCSIASSATCMAPQNQKEADGTDVGY